MLLVIGGGGGVLAIAVLGLVIFLVMNGGGDKTAAKKDNPAISQPDAGKKAPSGGLNDLDGTSDDDKPATPKDSDSIPAGKSKICFDWPESDRKGCQVTIGNRKEFVPEKGEVAFIISPGKVRIICRRRKYEPFERTLVIKAGETQNITPTWKKLDTGGMLANLSGETVSSGDEQTTDLSTWIQDWEYAKKIAAKENKSIMFTFVDSTSQTGSGRIIDSVLEQDDFVNEVKKNYILVYLDFATQGWRSEKIREPASNQRLMEHFGLSSNSFPAFVLTDAEGLPYAITTDASTRSYEGTLKEFRQAREEVLVKRDSFYDAAKKIKDDSTQQEEFLNQINDMAEFLKEKNLLRYYHDPMRQWYAKAKKVDPKNAKGLLEKTFTWRWKTRYDKIRQLIDEIREHRRRPSQTEIIELQSEAPELQQEFDQWHRKLKFKDSELGASMYKDALYLLLILRGFGKDIDKDLLTEYAKAGLGYNPKDSDTVKLFKSVVDETLSSGSGFVVAAGGYIMTNNHVVEDAARDGEKNIKVMVRLTPDSDPLLATIVARDTDRDMALIKVDDPKMADLSPMPVTDKRLRRTEEVAAFGYPLGDRVSKEMKFTDGRVSSVASDSSGEMDVLNVTVNPGNSGGPLFNLYGEVAGIVTAKSAGGQTEDSYGLSRPGEDIIDFMKKNIPNFKQVTVEGERKKLEWMDIDQRHSKSIVMILIVKE